MSAGDLTPNDTDLGATDLLGGAVDKGDTLAKVELGLLGSGNTLNLDQGNRRVVGTLGALVRQVLALDIQTVSLGHYCGCGEPWTCESLLHTLPGQAVSFICPMP